MHGPASSGWLLVALCALTGAYCLLRLRSSVAEQRRTAGAEAVMGFGMAAMAVPAAVLAPPRWAWALCAAVFAAAALRSLWTVRADPRHHLHHLVGSLAMVHMAVPMATGTHTGSAPLTGALLLYFAGYVLWSGTRLVPAAVAAGADGGTPAAGWGDRPELAQACRLSMGIAMVAMLLTL
ncbi:DUF5134 domain-containing protein [Streptomyces minutiscleroticus]|uniref:DUF5134 domain-containing protein n=1 Tax=Streptomyces minutiscleroticus TaxID=68238 RepID=A0A918KUI8_9ACTN|nr:DUF5134 domain-containing protein [Streptomyces minutiscleroticus]GGX77320.1 DUF5134 domain-containing protein [Streptomyces minutiscleroticus]